MRECPPAALGTGNIIFPAKIHSKSMPVVIITSEHLDGDEQENCTSCNSPFVSVWAIIARRSRRITIYRIHRVQ